MAAISITEERFIYCLADPDTHRPHYVGTTKATPREAGERMIRQARTHNKKGEVYDWIRSLGDRDPWIVRLSGPHSTSIYRTYRVVWAYELSRLGAPLIGKAPPSVGNKDVLAEVRRTIAEDQAKAAQG